MPVEDISRHLFDSRMRYSTALFEQGRTLTESDLNEMVRLEEEDRRRIVAETVCAHGSPNDGFRVGPEVTLESVKTKARARGNIRTIDFPIGRGSFYLGGYRFEHSTRPAETFVEQADWLTATLDPAAGITGRLDGSLPDQPDVARTDLVYLRGWEQSVTSIEDQEFRERALGGPDTSVRVRRMRRVQVLADVNARTCSQAEKILHKFLTTPEPNDPGGPHRFDDRTAELFSKARLTVDFSGDDTDADPCRPKELRGFLGAENQAIRVQLTAFNEFIWSYDNASPVYRVQVDPNDATRVTIKFLTLPRDAAAMPLEDQLVEILPWDARLANGEKAAATHGFRSVIKTSYDPETQSITLKTAVPAALVNWLNSLPPDLDGRFDEPGTERFFYLRVWSGGAPKRFVTRADDDPPNATTDIPLPGTGLIVWFSQYGKPGDYWILAARPNTPDQIVPWRLLNHAPPTGPRQFFTVLGLIRWSTDGTEARVHDCRERFRSLCKSNGCCTVIVGDGDETHGDYATIADAIRAVSETGGEVCLLAGTFREAVKIEGLRNIVIHGCGPRTRILPPAGSGSAILIDQSVNITIRDLAVSTPTDIGIGVQDRSSQITLRKLRIDVRDHGAIVAKVRQGLVVEECDIFGHLLTSSLTAKTTVGLEPLVFASGRDLRIERNRLDATGETTRDLVVLEPNSLKPAEREMEAVAQPLLAASHGNQLGPNETDDIVVPARADVIRTALGGLQIGGASRNVEIRRNQIVGGNGNGITLGSIRFDDAPDDNEWVVHLFKSYKSLSVYQPPYEFDPEGCVHMPSDPGGSGRPLPPGAPVPKSEGPVVGVVIVENNVTNMGLNGIAVPLLVFPENAPDQIVIRQIEIRSNRITNCWRMTRGQEVTDPFATAFGGIILASVEDGRILSNVIDSIGVEHREPTCGIFMSVAEGIAIEGNHLHRIGPAAINPEPLKLGYRGGIIIRLAIAPTEVRRAKFEEDADLRQSGVPAVVIHDNVVVAREGRALFLAGMGTMSVTDNQFTAHGSESFSLLRVLLGASIGATVDPADTLAQAAKLAPRLAQLGLFIDALAGNAVFIWNIGTPGDPQGFVEKYELEPVEPQAITLIGGNLAFNDNEVVFDCLNPTSTTSLCAVFLLSNDQITMCDNQVDCDIERDFVMVNTLVSAATANVVGNRFTEGRGCYWSAVTIGQAANVTALNIGSHCVLHGGGIEPSAATTGAHPVPVRLDLNPALDPTYCPNMRRKITKVVDEMPQATLKNFKAFRV